MAVQLPQFMPFQTGTQFVDNLLGLRRQGSQERQLDIRQQEADLGERDLDFRIDRMHRVEEPLVAPQVAQMEAQTDYQHKLTEQQEILNYFLPDEKGLTLEGLELDNAIAKLQLELMPEMHTAEIGRINAQIENLMAETGMTNAETEFFLKTMPLRIEDMEIMNRMRSLDLEEREQALKEYMALAEERMEAAVQQYRRYGLENDLLVSQLDTDAIKREAIDLGMRLTEEEIKALELTNERLAMDTEQRRGILPYETSAIIQKLKAQRASAYEQEAEALAGFMYRNFQEEVSRAALRDQAELDMIQLQRDIAQQEKDFNAFRNFAQFGQQMYQPYQNLAWDTVYSEMEREREFLYNNEEARMIMAHEHLEAAKDFFEDEILDDIIAEAGETQFAYRLLDTLSKAPIGGAAQQWFANIRDTQLEAFQESVRHVIDKAERGEIGSYDHIFMEDFELYLEQAMNEFIVNTPEIINDRIMGPGSALFGERLGEMYDMILKQFNVPNVDFATMGMDYSPHDFGGYQIPFMQSQPPAGTAPTTQRPISPFGWDLGGNTRPGVVLQERPFSFIPQY